MPSQFLIHDAAMGIASDTLRIISPCLREGKKAEAFRRIYEAAKERLKRYEAKADRMNRRVTGG